MVVCICIIYHYCFVYIVDTTIYEPLTCTHIFRGKIWCCFRHRKFLNQRLYYNGCEFLPFILTMGLCCIWNEVFIVDCAKEVIVVLYVFRSTFKPYNNNNKHCLYYFSFGIFMLATYLPHPDSTQEQWRILWRMNDEVDPRIHILVCPNKSGASVRVWWVNLFVGHMDYWLTLSERLLGKTNCL